MNKPKFPLYYGWVIVAIVALARFTESAEIYPVLAVLLKPMTEEFGWSRSVFAGAMAIGTLIGGVFGPIVGPVVDRFGARWTVFFSFAFLGGSMILMATITELWHFYAIQIFARVLALGIIGLALQIIIPKWFIVKRGRAVAFAGLGGRMGNAFTPLYVQYLVTMFSWRVATATTGAVLWVTTLLPVALFLRRQPEDMGLLPDGIKPEEKSSTHGKEEQNPANTSDPEISLSLGQVAKLPAFYFLVAAISLSSVVGPALNLHMIPYFTDKGLDPAIAVLTTTILFITGAIGSLVFGFLAERFSIRQILSTNYLMLGLGMAGLLLVDSTPKAFTWAIYMGLVQGGGFTLNQVLFADYFGRDSLGAIRGVISPIQLGANAIGPLAAAYAYDVLGNYFAIFLIFGLLRLISGALVLFAKQPTKSTFIRE